MGCSALTNTDIRIVESVRSAAYESQRFRKAALALGVLCMSALGPYILPQFGLRTDHVAIYSIGAFVLLHHVARGRFLPYGQVPSTLAFILILSLAWVTMATLLGGHEKSSLNQLLADAEKEIQPIVLVFVTAYYAQTLDPDSRVRLLRFVAGLISVLLAAHAILQIISLYYDVQWFIFPFLRNDPSGIHDALKGYQERLVMQRYCGVFGVPIEAGSSYCLGFITWLYWTSTGSPGTKSWLLAPLLLAGGTLPLSKVFILGAPVISIIFSRFSAVRGRGFNWIGILVLVLAVVLFVASAAQWGGKDVVETFLDFQGDDAVGKYTGGRYGGEEGWMAAEFWRFLRDEPLGYGLAAADCPGYDSGYTASLIKGGVVALLLLCILLLVMLKVALSVRSGNRLLGGNLVCLCVLAAGANLGGPALNLNRFSVLFWVFLTLSFSAAAAFSSQQDMHEANGYQDRIHR